MNFVTNLIAFHASENSLSQDVIYISLFVFGGHVCMPVCIRIVFKLLCFSLFLLQAAHVANKVVYNFGKSATNVPHSLNVFITKYYSSSYSSFTFIHFFLIYSILVVICTF